MKARIYVTLKREVLDPQGDAVKQALGALGFAGVKDVRIGKLVEIELDVASDAALSDEGRKVALRSMCEKLLANPVIEDFELVSA